MDGFQQLLSSTGGIGGGNPLAQLISGGSFGAGEIGNILRGQKEASYQNQILNLFKNPGQLAALVAKLQQPLNNGLTQAVGNQVQGNLAERGLAQAPGIFAASEAQGLAPYYQQNQQTAMNSVLQLLGMPASTFKNPVNNSGALSMFLKTLQQPGGAGYNQNSGFTFDPNSFTQGLPFMPSPDTSVPFDATFSGVNADSGNS
jgi:hypothetical protein